MTSQGVDGEGGGRAVGADPGQMSDRVVGVRCRMHRPRRLHGAQPDQLVGNPDGAQLGQKSSAGRRKRSPPLPKALPTKARSRQADPAHQCRGPPAPVATSVRTDAMDCCPCRAGRSADRVNVHPPGAKSPGYRADFAAFIRPLLASRARILTSCSEVMARSGIGTHPARVPNWRNGSVMTPWSLCA